VQNLKNYKLALATLNLFNLLYEKKMLKWI